MLRLSLSGLWCIIGSAHVWHHAGVGAQVVYLDLRKVKIQQDAGNLINVGPCACLAGQIALVQGQQGAPSQACCSTPAFRQSIFLAVRLTEMPSIR